MTQARSLVSAAGVYLLAAVVARVQFFITLPLVSRQLSPVDYGVLTVAGVVAVFVSSTVQSTISGAVERFYADHVGVERAECLGTIFAYLALVSCGMFVAAFAVGPWVVPALVDSAGYPYLPYFAIPIATALLAALNAFATALFRIQERPSLVLAYSLVRLIAAVAGVYIAVGVLDLGLAGYLVAMLASELLVAAASLPPVLRQISPRFRTPYLKEILRFTLPLAPYVFLALARDTGDRWILLGYVDMDQVGIYGLGFGIAVAMNMVVSSLTVPYAAVMMKRFPGRVAPEVARANLEWFKPAATHAVVLMLLAYAVFLLLVQDVVRIMTPTHFHEAWKPAAMIGGAFVLRGLYLIPHNVLQWTRRTVAIPVVTAVGLAVGLPALALLAPHIGIAAGGVGLGTCYFVSWLASAAAVPRLRWLLPADLRWTSVALVACVAAGFAAAHPPFAPVLWAVLRGIAVLGMLCAAWYWVYRHDGGMSTSAPASGAVGA